MYGSSGGGSSEESFFQPRVSEVAPRKLHTELALLTLLGPLSFPSCLGIRQILANPATDCHGIFDVERLRYSMWEQSIRSIDGG